LAVLCGPDDQRGNPYVQGSIKRIEPSQKLANELGNTPLQERTELYANESLWYDSLKILADLRLTNPNDVTLANDWKELLYELAKIMLQIFKESLRDENRVCQEY
jgi:hypothetical protein